MLGRANYVYNPLSIFMLILQAKCSLLCYIVYSIPIWFNICLEDDTGRYTHTWWYPTQHTHMFNCALCSTQRGTLAEKFQVLKGQCHDIFHQFEQAKTILRNFTQTWSVIILLEQNLYLNIVRKFQYSTITCNRVSSGKRKSSRNCLYLFIMGSKFLWRCPFLKSTGGQCHVINKFFFKRQVYLKVVKVCQNRFTFISK